MEPAGPAEAQTVGCQAQAFGLLLGICNFLGIGSFPKSWSSLSGVAKGPNFSNFHVERQKSKQQADSARGTSDEDAAGTVMFELGLGWLMSSNGACGTRGIKCAEKNRCQRVTEIDVSLNQEQ